MLEDKSFDLRGDYADFKNQYTHLYPLYKRLCQEVIFIIRDEVEKAQLKIHGITFRIKTFDSLYKKIIRKHVSTTTFENIADVAGVRLVCLYRSDLENINKLISQNFEILSMDTSRTRSETQFGYMSDHYVVKLGKDCKGKRYDELKSLQCEIQVRTILMDAWATVSHHLDYKKETDIPSTLRKDFNAVSGLLYAADTHFEIFREGILRSKEQLVESIKKSNLYLKQEINLDSISTYLQWRFPERERFSVSTYSDLVTDLNRLGYTTIGDLDRAIHATEQVAQSLENKEMRQKFYSDTGFVRICLMLYDHKYYDEMKKLHFKKNKPLFDLIDEMRSQISNKEQD